MANRCFSLIIAAILLLFGQTRYFGQSNENDLLHQKIEVHFTDATLLYVLNKLAAIQGIPIGLEKSATEEYKAKLNIDVENGTLKEVLNAIIQQEPAYKWEVIDGVINFTPTAKRYSFVAILLDTSVNCFAPVKGISKFGIRDTITNLPEVRSLLTANNIGVERFMDYPYRESIYANSKVNLNMSNTTVRGILNKVVKDSEHKIWVVEMSGRHNGNLLISF